MKINEKILNFIDILNDLDDISKKLYLESPEIWIDFSDKVGEQNLDEMVLFYAAKYNYVSIFKYAINNNTINLDTPSRNKNYSSIKDHLLAVSKDYKSDDVYNYLSGNVKSSQNTQEKEQDYINIEKTKEEIKENKHDKYCPVFLCPHCNSNILQCGYKVYEEINFSFSSEKNSAKEISRKRDNRVYCCNCNNNINNVTTELLENICSIQNCKSCGKDLTKIGIDEKINMIFNHEDKKFMGKEKSYNCPSCHKELDENQKKYFNL